MRHHIKLLTCAAEITASVAIVALSITSPVCAVSQLMPGVDKSDPFAKYQYSDTYEGYLSGRYQYGSLIKSLCPDSQIAVGSDLTPEDAAMRLYYLGFLTGNGGNVNGGIEFSLERGLNRVESAVFAVRLLGAEQEALLVHYEHPFTDVPDWASDYVGYIYNCRLLDDIVESALNAEDLRFEPQKAETAERFSSYILYALGYRMSEGDYTYYMAAEYTREIGILTVSRDEPLTRGAAALAMYNTLRTTIKNAVFSEHGNQTDSRIYSDVLSEMGVINYNDAIFLIWNKDSDEIDAYLSAVGYNDNWVLPDGYYKISDAELGKMLNVAVSGMNNDYDGVGVTLWEASSDITQTFRIERTERGTYYIYSAASRNGYGRVMGGNFSTGDNLALYRSTGVYAKEFRITGAADGTWTIYSDSDGRSVGTKNKSRNGEPVILTENKSEAISWKFEREGIMNSRGEEMAVFVADSLRVTQGAYDDYSHMNQNALDIQPTERAVKAPFNAKVVRIDASEYACNAVWIESVSKVRYADGSYDYMTLCLMHDNDISDIYLGMGLTQGEYFYDSGDYGVSSGKHVHVAVYRGRLNGTMKLGSGDIRCEDALFLPDDTYVYDGYGLNWTVLSMSD